MEAIYTKHLIERLKQRKFPYNFPNTIYNQSEQDFYDNMQKSYIAIKTMHYANKDRKIMIAYNIDENRAKIKTIHPITDREINQRVESKRWMKI